MIPASISATSLENARNCMSMFHAQNIKYARSIDNDAARNGTTVHFALEVFVTKVFVEKSMTYDPQFLHDLYDMKYLDLFGKLGVAGDELWESGHKMLNTWLTRHGLDDGRTVFSTEEKRTILIPTESGASVKLNFVIDRLDRINDMAWEVIDYKSSNFNIKSGSLKQKLQAIIYALAVYYEHPEAETVKVTFEMLKYAQSSVYFTKDEVKVGYISIKHTLEKIIAADENNLPETINASCGFCVRKATCKALQKNIEVGGLFALTLEEQIDLRTQLELQRSGMSGLMKELDKVIEVAIGSQGKLELDTGTSKAYFRTTKERTVTSPERIRDIVGEEIFDQYGRLEIPLGELDKMLKDPRITDEQREQIDRYIQKGYTEPSLNYKNKRDEQASQLFAPPVAGKLTPAATRAPIPGLN